MTQSHVRAVTPLSEVAPELHRVLKRNVLLTAPLFTASQVSCETVMVAMRDGVRLATDIYLPPSVPAPIIAVRTPYGRSVDSYVGLFMSLARRGYGIASQDCRGTGDSEPEEWDYYIYESDDGVDFAEWITRQPWFDGFLGCCGSSYIGLTQWHMALHPKTSTIVPEVCGLGIAVGQAKSHMFINAYARSVGKGKDKVSVPYFELEEEMLEETLSTGYFNDPLYRPLPEALLECLPRLRGLPPGVARQQLWEHYCSLPCAGRAELAKRAFGVDAITILEAESWPAIFGHGISAYAPTMDPADLCALLRTPVLLNTGWYDWGLDDTLATWELLQRAAPEPTRRRCRLFISPSAHNVPGYHEGVADHPELQHAHRTASSVELLMRWYAAVREDKTDDWPTVIYYLMGANEWCAAEAWPPPEARVVPLYLSAGGGLSTQLPAYESATDRYTYDPCHPTPTVGGSILSYAYPPGSVDVSAVQKRPDVMTYTTGPLEYDLDVVGPLRLTLFASSSVVDTDFIGRLSDMFPDGRAVQLQNGILRTRYRNRDREPQLLQPDEINRFEIDLWATGNRFKAGHRLRLDISSADFPRFDRNANRGGEPGEPTPAAQTIFHGSRYPSQLLLNVLGKANIGL